MRKIEVIEGILRQAARNEDKPAAKTFRVRVEVIRKPFDGGTFYDFRLLDYPAVELGFYDLEVEIDGEKHGRDIRFVPDHGATEVRWSEPNLDFGY